MVRLSPRSFRVVAEHEQVKKLSSAPALADHVGRMLKESREAIGYDLSHVAHALCIRTLYLQALEEGRHGDLPGVTYAVGFVRTYADYLGLDSGAVVARYKSETAAARNAKHTLAFPEPRPDRPFPSVAIAALSVVLIAGVVAGWVYLRETPTMVTVAIAPPPAPTDATATQPAATVPLPSAVGGLEISIATAAGEPAPDPIAPAPVADAAPLPSPPSAAAPPAAAIIPIVPIVPADAQLAAPAPVPVAPVQPLAPQPPSPAVAAAPPARTSAIAANAGSLPPPEPAATDAVAAAASDTQAAAETLENTVAALPAVPEGAATGGAGREYGAANRDARIILTALAESWVQIRDAQQNVVLTRMLQPGDTFRVPNRDDLTLLTGNAGGLEITVDGTAIPPLGPSGAVRRDIALTPVQLIGG